MKTLIITEKTLIAKQCAKVGVFGAPTSFKLHDNLYFENENYIIAPCQGHLFERILPYEIDETYGFKYKKDESFNYASPELLKKAKLKRKQEAKRVTDALAKILQRKDIKEIVASGDADGEGEKIVRDAIRMLGTSLPPNIVYTRLYNTGSFDSAPAVKKAFDDRKPLSTDIYENLFMATNCRSDTDYYGGMVFNKVYTDKTGSKFQYGRVKMAILSMICNRELTIQNFKPRSYSNVRTYIGDSIDNAKLKFLAFREDEVIDEMGVKKKEHSGQFFDDGEVTGEKIVADVKAANYTGKVVENRTYVSKPRKPLLYNLNEFNADFMSLYKVSAEYSEECIEFLRFKDYVTYTRTDGNYYPTIELDNVKKLQGFVVTQFEQEFSELGKKDSKFKLLPVTTDLPLFNDAAAAKQNHTPIVITRPLTEKDIAFLKDKHSSPEKKGMMLTHLYEAYQLVATRCAVQFMPDAEVEKQNIEIEIGGYLFEANAERTIYEGWKALDKNASRTNDKTLNFAFNKGDTIKVDGVHLEKHETKAPPRLTEDSLRKACVNVKQVLVEEINLIEDAKEKQERMDRYTKMVKLFENAKGIGTQGTLKTIFNEVKDYGAFEVVKGKLVPTDKGWFLYNTVSPFLRSLELTAIMESKLIEVRSGTLSKEQYHNDFIVNILGKLALSEVNREIATAPRDSSPKMIAYAEKIAQRLNISLPDDYKKNATALSLFIDKHQNAYKALFEKAPDYVIKSFESNKDKVPSDVYALISKTEPLTKEEFSKMMEVFKTLPRVYDSFTEKMLAYALSENIVRQLSDDVVQILKRNKPSAEEYQKVQVALNNVKQTISDKQRAVLENNADTVSDEVKALLAEKQAYTREELALIKTELDKCFGKNTNSKSTGTKSKAQSSTSKKSKK